MEAAAGVSLGWDGMGGDVRQLPGLGLRPREFVPCQGQPRWMILQAISPGESGVSAGPGVSALPALFWGEAAEKCSAQMKV